MQSILRSVVLCWFTLVVALGTTARADDALAKPTNAIAREHLQQGNKLYRLREFEKAIEEYKAGVLAEDTPVFAYNLGQCFRQLGKFEDAIWHYERFLDRGRPTGEIRSAVEGFVHDMKAELEKKVMAEPPTDAAPASPTPRLLPPIRQDETALHAPPGESWYQDTVGWTLAGAGTIAGLTAGYLFLDGNNLDDQSNSENRQDVRNQLRGKASTRRTVGAIVGVGGLGLLAAGVIKLVITPSPTAEPVNRPVGIGFTGNGVLVFGSF